MAILPPPLRLIDNQLNAQNDAFFYSISPERSEGSTGFQINDFSNVGEGPNSGCFIENFNMTDAPLGSGVLLLAGSAMAWVLVKDKRRKSINN